MIAASRGTRCRWAPAISASLRIGWVQVWPREHRAVGESAAREALVFDPLLLLPASSMPLRHQPPTLRKATMLVIASNFESICYGCHTIEDQHAIMASDAYLDVEGPFAHLPQPIIEDMAEETKHVTHLRKHHLHLFLTSKLTKWAAHGVADKLTAFPLLITRCQNLRQLDVSYLRHINPNVLLSLVPRFSALVTLNLRMTLTVDQMLGEIGRNCPHLRELNLMSTPITDRGMIMLCVGEDGRRISQNLLKLVIAETFITIAGATIVLQSLPQLREFDFDQIFDVLENLENWDSEMEKKLLRGMAIRLCEETAPAPCYLPLVTLFSSAEQVCLKGLDAATRLCPEATHLVLANAWLSNEDLYKFMLFEKLTSLSLTNSEGLTLDFHDGVLPLLMSCGTQLQNLILANFTSVDIVALGRSCKKLRNIAMSNIAQYDYFGRLCNEWFTELRALELWSDPQADLNPEMFKQLLYFSPNIQNILFKGCEVLTDKLFGQILEINPMKKLSHLTLDHCHTITGETLHNLLDIENEIGVFRIWSCQRISRYTNSELSRRICDENMDVYLEWFQYEE